MLVDARRVGDSLHLVATEGFPVAEPMPGPAVDGPPVTGTVVEEPVEPAPAVPFPEGPVPCDEVLHPIGPSSPEATLLVTLPATGDLEPTHAAEVVATLGLLLVILGVARRARPSGAAIAVGLYIGAAYFFTSSTSFANPAVTMARTLSDTFAGIAPRSTPAFVVCQLIGLVTALAVAAVLFSRLDEDASAVVVPHEGERL